MTAANATGAAFEPAPRLLTIREAAAATGTNTRSIRRRLASGAFPGAYKGIDPGQPDTLIWRIPVDELENAGLRPVTGAADEAGVSVVAGSAPTAANLIGTDRFARLRSELAEAVASAELALLRAEAEKWRAVADERGHALERADVALHSLTTALGTAQSPAPTAVAAPEPAVDQQASSAPATAPPTVPSYVRSEAVLYAESMSARSRARTSRTAWWRRRR